MEGLSEAITFWEKVKGFVVSTMAKVFSEEEVVAVSPGSVTVRPYGTNKSQELRHLIGSVFRPGDRAIVVRLPALKFALGTPSTRGVAAVLPIPFGGFNTHWGRSTVAARADHAHGSADVVPVAALINNGAIWNTTNTSTYTGAEVGRTTVSLAPGRWSFMIDATANMWRSVASGAVFMRVDVVPDTPGSIVRTYETSQSVDVAERRESIRIPIIPGTTIYFPDGGDVDVIVYARGDGAAGTTSIRGASLTGFFWRIGSS